MAKTQLNVRVEKEEIASKLEELKAMGFSQSKTVRAGIVKFYEFAKSNPAEAAALALKA
jgi:hypothetical protein